MNFFGNQNNDQQMNSGIPMQNGVPAFSYPPIPPQGQMMFNGQPAEVIANGSFQQQSSFSQIVQPVVETQSASVQNPVQAPPVQSMPQAQNIVYPQGFEQMSFSDQVLSLMVANNASDCYPVVGYHLGIKIAGKIYHIDRIPELTQDQVLSLIYGITNTLQKESFDTEYEVDFAYSWNGYRFRVNAFHQMNKPSLTIRYLRNDINSLDALGLPPIISELAKRNSGIILVCGVTGSGKSTTLAAMVDFINEHFSKHIITIEDPVEYTYEKKQSIIEQREVGTDTKTFASAMKSALRQNPNVLLLGEMRDLESIASAITIAESGHLVLATIHARNSVQCINKIIDAFPADQQAQVRVQLSEALAAIVTQKLIPGTDGKQKLVMEIMINNSGIANMIREQQTHQIESSIQTGKSEGMQLLDEHIFARLQAGEITKENAILYANKPQDILNALGQ